jgi:hypothetical protein
LIDPKRDEYDASTLRARRCASTCRWGTPTLFLDVPLWLDSESCPWACVRDPTPRVLATTEIMCDLPRLGASSRGGASAESTQESIPDVSRLAWSVASATRGRGLDRPEDPWPTLASVKVRPPECRGFDTVCRKPDTRNARMRVEDHTEMRRATTMSIRSYRFGKIEIDGRSYTSDVILTPEGVVAPGGDGTITPRSRGSRADPRCQTRHPCDRN